MTLPSDHDHRTGAWRDPATPVAERVAALLDAMTLEEKVAQLNSVWIGGDASGGPEPGAAESAEDANVAPHQHEQGGPSEPWERLIASGLGQLTRPFGTAPVDPADGARRLAGLQRRIAAAGRFGIPALAHEECLSGFTTWTATVYPTPLAWGATFDPGLVEEMAARIGASMRAVGVHQGLAPVLDVTRDARWGRTEETIGEDPYLVGTVGTAYVRGLQSAGVVATLKHFAGYSASRAARNLAPVSVGPRELADVLLPPFEMAVREGGARSVMHAYTENDGLPAAADAGLLTGLLRDRWGFAGTVVADYFGIGFLQTLHGVAGSPGESAALALSAGVDVELPAVHCYGEPLLAAVRAGEVAEELVDRAARRVLTQKCELGLLDAGWSPEPPGLAPAGGGRVDLDPPEQRDLARRIAEESVVLLADDAGVLPLRPDLRLAVVGPCADDPMAMLGCYSFPSHVGVRHPDVPLGVRVPTVLEGLRGELPGARIHHEAGCAVDGAGTSGIAAAVDAARAADVCVAVLGDRAGLFGRGTSGEGCDVPELRLPGVQERLLDALLDSGTPVVLVLLTGRPYALGEFAGRLAAQLQAFFPGEEGGPAVAGVLSGRVNPSGRLPVSVPRLPGGQPAGYLAPRLGHRGQESSVDPTPLFPFGHGRGYTRFTWEDPRLAGEPLPADRVAPAGTDATVRVGCAVRNVGDRDGTEVVQLYLSDPVARTTRPVRRLVGYARVAVPAGGSRRVEFAVPADLAAYTGPDGRRVVEPGELHLALAASSADIRFTARIRLTGETRVVDHTRRLTSTATVR
ncbi:beta-xylosidase/alpha-l-arabinosidase [Marinitenerispora sediminis]|uniref:Glycosyl hydrolase n=1 Tax=Marinitenerispora sediminis TaxID=1931232 RepID=A0A368T3K6_9ACTN|nr:glycoside hydrolase family 3 N-terminal domain-containing protein [Marinitenerispora sediminis]RCV54098.1 glycosyl hydrolase [Marinitenerispora sediminis]RCV56821.1 glycosyl hydrolase [Marinitenerispora sediminis]RCV56944.1 glycosyl hydrolase [Marinitenerispora sediminis]